MEIANKGEDGFFDDRSRDDLQKLFLLEVLVDNLFIQTDSSSPNLNKDLAANMADTCVMFQFLHYPPLVVCESDFIGTAVSGKDTSHITFKSGKSCFFSLRSPKGPILPVPFEVKVSVIRKMKEGVLPDKLELGKTTIDLGDNFTELLKQNTDENCDSLPLSKIKKGTFDIKDDGGKKVGSLTAFLRISCFGKLIITQFSLNKEDEKTFLFKGTDLKEVCKKDLGVAQPEGLTFPDRGEGSPGTTRGYQTSNYGQSQQCPPDPGCYQTPCYGRPGYDGMLPMTGGVGPPCSTPKPPKHPLSEWERSQIETFDPRQGSPGPARGGLGPQCSTPKPPKHPLSEWEQSQIETFDPRQGPPRPTRGGLGPPCSTPKPPKHPLSEWEQSQIETFDPRQGPPRPTRGGLGPPCSTPKPPYQPLSEWERSQIETFDPRQGPPGPARGGLGPPMGGGRLCDCPYPVPPSVMSKYGQRSARNMDLAPGEVGMQDDQVVFQLPLKKPGDPLSEKDQQIDSQVYYKLTSAEETRDGVQKNTVNIKSDDIPGLATKTAVSPVSGLPVDDGHDVFLLKIGKKCEGDKKRNLELELRTPKMKEPKPPMSDKDTQYLESDVPKTSKKGSKDKGKGKGKGGKKGKK